MMVILSEPDEGYFERTWWRLFWAYLMKVAPETLRLHYIWYIKYVFFILKKLEQFSHLYYILLILQEFSR